MPEVKTIPAKYICIDIVGFTHNRSVEAQSDIIRVLNDIVESSVKEYGIKKDEVMFLPASDGICVALLNIGSPFDIHLQIALSIVGKVYKHSINTPNKMRKFEVRIGINSYTDNLVTDINGNQNIAGAGVNLASRIMKMADGNQILISRFVFDDFRHHEKYAALFRPFRAKIKEDVELPVYQFISKGYEGLNVSTPVNLRDSAPTAPVAAAAAPKPQASAPPRPAEPVRKTPVGVESPIFVTQQSVTKTPPATTQTAHTLSYLKGILPEAERAETQTEPTITKTETVAFLEQDEPRKNRAFVWAFVIVLMISGAALGAWFWMSKKPSSTASQTLANKATAVPTAAPASNPAVASSQAQNQTVAETTEAPKNPSATETEASSNSASAFKPRSTRRRSATRAPRPVIERTVAQRPKPQAAQPKQQTVRASKPKSTRRVTLEDLIN